MDTFDRVVSTASKIATATEKTRQIATGDSFYPKEMLVATSIIWAGCTIAEAIKEAHSPANKVAATLAIEEEEERQRAERISRCYGAFLGQEDAQDKKKSQTPPNEQSKTPGADEILFVGPYYPGGGVSPQPAPGKGFLRRFLGF